MYNTNLKMIINLFLLFFIFFNKKKTFLRSDFKSTLTILNQSKEESVEKKCTTLNRGSVRRYGDLGRLIVAQCRDTRSQVVALYYVRT